MWFSSGFDQHAVQGQVRVCSLTFYKLHMRIRMAELSYTTSRSRQATSVAAAPRVRKGDCEPNKSFGLHRYLEPRQVHKATGAYLLINIPTRTVTFPVHNLILFPLH
jgi:hypothetical protein